MTLRLNLTNASGVITGSFLGGSGTPEVQLERIASRLSAEDSPPAGRYTFAMTVNTTNRPSQLIPGGAGFGLGKLARAGTLRLGGTLPDGATFAESTRLSRAGRCPLYVPLANGRGILIGWLAVSTNDTRQLDGSLQWLRQSGSEFAQYPGGFTNQLSMLASAYFQPAIDDRVLNWTNGIAQLNGGLLELGITNHVELVENNVLSVVDDSTGLNFSLDLKNRSREWQLCPSVGGHDQFVARRRPANHQYDSWSVPRRRSNRRSRNSRRALNLTRRRTIALRPATHRIRRTPRRCFHASRCARRCASAKLAVTSAAVGAERKTF